jgi:hypothetical protein
MIIFGGLFSDDVSFPDHKSLNGRMVHENRMLGLMKEAVVAFLKCLQSYDLLGGTSGNYKILWRIFGVPAEI